MYQLKQTLVHFLIGFLLTSGNCFATSRSEESCSESEEVGTRNRFWPVQDPNQFGIASNLHRVHPETQTETTAKLSAKFKTRDGRTVAVFDDVLEYNMQIALLNYINFAGFWRFHNYNGPQQTEKNQRRSGIPWTASFDPKTFSASQSGQRILRLLEGFPRHDGKESEEDDEDYEPYKVVCNILRRGDVIHLHHDADHNATEFTALLYLNQLWRKNDYGELLFYDDGDVFATVGPKFNRIVVWESSIDYLTRPPGMAYRQSQFFLMVHYTRNHSKVLHYERVKHQSGLEQKSAEAELFTSMNEPVSENINVGEHVTQKYVSEKGKKIFVFDDLFDSGDLDKLRMFTVNHGNYFFDDTIDSDSDNVQWIAAFSIDAFVQSRLWNITRQVAKYVSGSDQWFPYDIACNIVRSFDHTRIHEDCEELEDEWTFLLYLNPGWKAHFYGETVFRESNEDNAEYIASVLPQYGRVVIFQGIIPHSARPPSTLFTGARLSFAVKLSVTPWLARVKMLKQEFAHEESMHQSVLSIMKYYHDDSFEALHMEHVISMAQDIMEMEHQQRQRYLKDLQDTFQLDDYKAMEEEDHQDGDEEDRGDDAAEGGDDGDDYKVMEEEDEDVDEEDRGDDAAEGGDDYKVMEEEDEDGDEEDRGDDAADGGDDGDDYKVMEEKDEDGDEEDRGDDAAEGVDGGDSMDADVDNGEFDFEESYRREDDSEFPEITQRKEYIYNLIRTLKPDADALTAHYKQFLLDREAMTEKYVRELAKLI